jgi:hypothetical protein
MLVGKTERKMSFGRRKHILQKDKIETDMKYVGDKGGSGRLERASYENDNKRSNCAKSEELLIN